MEYTQKYIFEFSEYTNLFQISSITQNLKNNYQLKAVVDKKIGISYLIFEV